MPRPSASAVRPGAIAWVLAAQFFITQVVVASAWLRHFSLKTDYISDLGNTVCAVTFANSERAVCSPWHLAMNLSFMLLGVTMIIGAVLTRDAFPPGWVRELAVLLFSAAGVGVFIVGTYPINTNNARHVLGAGLNFVSGNIALIVFGLALSQRAARTGLRNFSVCAGALGLLATLLFVSGHFLGIGLGGMERVAAYPMTVWQIVVGIAFLRGDSTNPAASHRLAPTGVALLAVTLARVGFAQAAPASPRSRATVFTGHFLTLDTLTPRADAIAVGDGRILAVGTRADVRKVAGKGAPRVSLPGVTLPGFVDAHVHAAALGEVMEAVELRGLGKAALLERVRLAARTAPAGQWIHGSGWDQSFWTPAEFPTARELDAVSAGHPVVLERIDGHAIWVNDEVLTRASITRETPEGTGGRIVRDASGAPTGVFVDDAMALVHHAEPPLPMAARVRRLRAALAKYARWGLTEIHDAGIELADIAAYKAIGASGPLPVRVYAMASTTDSTLRTVLANGPMIDLLGGTFTLRTIKVVEDGALGSRGALLGAPYADDPTRTGFRLVSAERLDTIIVHSLARGFQVAVHAIGDQSNHDVLDAFERAGPSAKASRFRLEHASMIRDADLPRLAQLGVIASMQPVFVGEYSRFAESRVGASRLPWTYRIRDVLDAGAVLATGTDYPASDTGDPILTLFALVTRRGYDGQPAEGWLPGQAIGVDAALRSMTIGPAFAAFEEKDGGALRVGRRADFTVLSGDPTMLPPNELRGLKVLRTIVGGRTTFR